MLKKIPQSLSPELVKTLMEMGHGDEIVIGDGNYPSASHTNNLIRCDGLMIPELLESILDLLPLDTYVDSLVVLMEVAKGDTYQPIIWETYKNILKESEIDNSRIEHTGHFYYYSLRYNAYKL